MAVSDGGDTAGHDGLVLLALVVVMCGEGEGAERQGIGQHCARGSRRHEWESWLLQLKFYRGNRLVLAVTSHATDPPRPVRLFATTTC